MFPVEVLGTVNWKANIENFANEIDRLFGDRSRNIKIMILYYIGNRKIKDELTRSFSELNFLSGEDIDIWTYYDSVRAESNFRNEWEMNAIIEQNQYYNRERIDNASLAQQNMDAFAKYFKCKGTMPYIILWDTSNMEHQTYMSIDYESERPIGPQIADIINNVRAFDYNWEKIEEYYKRNCKHKEMSVSVGTQLKKMFEINKLGIPIEDLVNDGYNLYECRRIAGRNRYVPVYKFLENYKRICGDNMVLAEEMEEIVEKYIEYIYTARFPFPEIKPYIENTSIGYLSRAQQLVKSRNQSFNCDYSLAIYCIGKALEDELNLGLVHLIRKELEIDLPRFYNRYQRDHSARCEYGGKFYNYNKRKNDNSLMYPQISVSRSIIFEETNDAISIAMSRRISKDELRIWCGLSSRFDPLFYSNLTHLLDFRKWFRFFVNSIFYTVF